MQKAFFRNAFAFLIAYGAIVRRGERVVIRRQDWLPLCLRSICGSIGIICNFYAIDRMNIADASILNKLSPFFAILASWFILQERASLKAWLTVVIAFIGALFIIKPSFEMDSLYAFVAAFGGMSAGVAYTFVRKLSQQGVNGTLIVAFFSGFSSVIILPLFILQYQAPTMMQWIWLLLTGVAAAAGQFCITTAYSYAPARDISVYDYSQVIFSALLGFLFLNQIPDTLSVAGYIIILAAAIIRFL